MVLVISGAETLKLDFESTAYPGYVSLAELTSFLYLAGVDKELFRRQIDQLLISTPSGRFHDPTALMAQLQAWKLSNALSFVRDTVSRPGLRPNSHQTSSFRVRVRNRVTLTLTLTMYYYVLTYLRTYATPTRGQPKPFTIHSGQ
jgi:hypothetical protein